MFYIHNKYLEMYEGDELSLKFDKNADQFLDLIGLIEDAINDAPAIYDLFLMRV